MVGALITVSERSQSPQNNIGVRHCPLYGVSRTKGWPLAAVKNKYLPYRHCMITVKLVG